MIICGIKITHDGAVAVLDGQRLLFSTEIEKLDNGRRYGALGDLDRIAAALAAHGLDVADVDRFVVDGWWSTQDGRPAIPTLLGGAPVSVAVAPYVADPFVPAPPPRHAFDGIPGSPLAAGYASYPHVSHHLFASYATGPYAGESAYGLVWDGGTMPRLYRIRPGAPVTGEYLGPLFGLVGDMFTYFCMALEPFARSLDGLTEVETVEYHLGTAGKATAYAGLGAVVPEALDALDKLVAELSAESLGPEVGSTLAGRCAAMFPDLSSADLIATCQEYVGRTLVSSLAEAMAGRERLPLCLAGGCALNIKWNSMIRGSGLFADVWVPPFPNDSGAAIGTAFCELLSLGGAPRLEWGVYSGPADVASATAWGRTPYVWSEGTVYTDERRRTVVDLEEAPGSPVRAYNEWDPLEEVIVGIVDGAHFPPCDAVTLAPLSPAQREVFRERAGRPFPADEIARARDELDQLVDVLEGFGVKVRRPDPRDHGLPFGAPGWSSTGLYDAMPRDLLLVVGEEIIEAPMAWRSRYFASSAYRSLLKEYFRAGARWTAAPRPELAEELYVEGWTDQPEGEPFRSVITEFEPTFDAADFMRCGRDIFVQRSHVTNLMGIEWLRRHLGEDYQVHVIELADDHPMHIDASLMPLAPGKLLIHPQRVVEVPVQFKDWEVRRAPEPVIPDGHPLYMTSKWINMNVLMLDETHMVVEAEDHPMQRFAESWGITPVPMPFRWFNSFGGSFHCATTDVRRRGELRCYF